MRSQQNLGFGVPPAVMVLVWQLGVQFERPAFFPGGRRGKWLRREYRVTSKPGMM